MKEEFKGAYYTTHFLKSHSFGSSVRNEYSSRYRIQRLLQVIERYTIALNILFQIANFSGAE